jgi:hypothetical protein
MRKPDATSLAIPFRPLAALALLAAAAAAAVTTAAACKTPVPADVPGEFTFHGVAVHPAAVRALYKSETGLIDLAAFETSYESRQWEDQPGWWVVEFDEDMSTGRSPFFAYAAFPGPIAGGAETYVLSVTFNEGEPADVDNIVLLRKNGTWLGLIRSWKEGSACEGGIIAERMEDDNFLYSRELTPADLLDLAVDPKLEIEAHVDLEATSESCFAAANFVYNLTQDVEDLVSVRLYDEPAVDEKGKTERFRYQSCFNRIFNDYLARGKTALTPKEVDEFAARFRDECLTPAAMKNGDGQK